MDKIKQIGFKAGEKPKRPVIQEDTSASKSYASIAYGISEGEIVGLIDGAKSVYLDGTPVESVSGDTNIPDVKIQERKGTNDQTHLEGFPAVVNEKQYNNIEMLQTTPFVHYINDTNLDAVGIRFTFGALQVTNPDNGNVSGITIEYAIDVQADGQGYQELLRTSIVGKYSAGYQRYHRIELPHADEGWEVRIRRLTLNNTSTYVADKMYLDAVAEILDVKMRYPNTALIGLKFDSERFSNIPKVDFRMRGKIIRVPANYDPVARTYAQSGAGTTNGIWNGQFKMAYTTNPAWIFYDLVLNRRYGLGNRIDASMLDKWSLYSIAQYCDVMVPDGEGGLEPRFTCNVYINNRFEAYDCLMQLAGVFRGIMYWSGTAIIAGCDRPQDPVFTYTRANIVGEFNYSGTRTKDRHSVVMVSFDDPRNSYKTEKEVVSDRKAISEIGIRTKDLAAFACTSRGQAQRAGKWALFKEQLETRIVTFALGMDGYIAPVGRIIEIADPLLAGRAIGGRIAAVSADKTTITLDRDTEVKVGERLVLNNEEGEQESRQVTSVSGRAVTVAVAFESPAVEHVWAIDSDDLQLMRFTVISISENRSQDNINFTVTALQHEPSLHEAADYSAYVDRNTYSVIDITTQKAPTEVVISSVNRINQGIDLTDLVISWKQAENAVKYQVQWRRDDGNWIQMPLQYGNQVTVENIYHGVYEAKVVAINAVDVNSLPASSAPTPINSKFAEPEVLASLTANGILFGVELNWKFPLYGSQNAAFVEIYWALNGDKSDEKLLGSYAYPTTETTLNGLSPHQTLYFRARLVDRNGEASGFTPWVTATVIADPEKLLDMLNGHIGLAAIDEELSKALEDTTAGVVDAKDLANQAKTAADNAQTTATNAGAAASDAAGKATAAANAVAKEVTDRVAAVTAETNARTAALTKEATDRSAAIAAETTARTAAINKEATDRATALTTQANTLKADSAAKVKALKDEVDPKLATLQDGITKVTTDYKAADTVVVGQLNAYKTSNDSAVASVLQKAESAVSTGATNSSAITAINGQITTINNTKLDASVISGYYTKGQTDAKAAEIAAGKVEEFSASISNEHLQELLVDGNTPAYSDGSLYQIAGFTMKEAREVGSTYTLRFKMSINRSGNDTTSYIRAYQGGNAALVRNYTEADGTIFEATFTATAASPINEIRFYHFPNTPSAKTGTSVTIHWASLVKAKDDAKAQTQAALDANSTAIQNTNAEVTRVDGVATAANNATTALAGRVSTVEGAVSTKAEAAALTALTTRVTSAEGVNTSQGSAITTLQNSVNHATTGLASKASSAALTAVDNKVTAANGRIDTTNSNVTTLTGRVSTVEGAVSTKAEAAALTALTTRVSNAEGVNTSQGSAITSLENSVNHATTGLATKASSSALTAVDNKVTAANGRIDTTNSDVTKLTGRVSTVEGAVSTKAEAAALTALTTRVGNAEGVNTSQGSAITTLQNKVNHATTGLATKAATSALTATNSEVSRVNGLVTGHTNQLTQLESDITTINGTLATKANASALNDIYTKNQTDAKATEIAAGEVSKYDASLVIGGANLFANSDFSSGTAGWESTGTGASLSVVTDSEGKFKQVAKAVSGSSSQGFKATNAAASALNLVAGDTYTMSGWLRASEPKTLYPAVDGAGNNNASPVQVDTAWQYFTITKKVVSNIIPRIYGNGEYFVANLKLEKGTKATDWTPSPQDTQDQIDVNATAIENTNTEVARVDGRVTTESNRTTTLTGRVSTVEGDIAKKADASALSALTTRVATEEGKSTSQGSAITALQNTINHATTGLATKASSGALTAVDNKVTAANGRIDTTNSNVTKLTGRVDTVEGDISKKADASALSALTTRVTTEEGKSTSQGTAITALQNTVNHATTGLATKASNAALTTVDNRVTTVDGRVTATNSNVATLTGRVSTVEGGLATKASVSALNALTTRVGTVEGGLATQATNTTNLTSSLAATDKIAKDALPKIGGGGSFKTFKEVLNYYLATSGMALNIVIETPITYVNNMFKISGKGYNYATTKSVIDFDVSGYAYQTNGSILQHGAKNNGTFPMRIRLGMKNGKLCVILSPKGTNFAYPSFTVDATVSYGTVSDVYQTGWSGTQVAEADLATSGITAIIEPSLMDVGVELEANANAINTTNTEVSRINGVVEGNVSDISNLTTSIAGKADASALNSLTARVVTEEGKSTSQGTAITNLQNAVNHSTTGLASKASSSALTTLNNQVQHSTTGLSAVNTKVDALKATIEHTTNGLASKASSSALTTLSNKVNHSTTGLDAIASKTTTLESDVAKALDVVTISDTRSTNQPPSWYWANYSKRTVNEFKTQTVIGVSGFFGGTYCNLETNIPYGDSSGGHIVQTATSSVDPSLYVQRVSTSTTAWGAWAQPIKDLRDGLAGKAAASAVESLTTRVGTAEGRITTEAAKLSTLSTTVGGHTTSIQTQTTSINGIQAKHTVKINNNGFVTGYGLISTANNGAVVSTFKVDADAFAVGKSGTGILPFVVTTAGQTISGIKYPAAGTWINAAYIASATIGTAHITDLAVTTAKIGNSQITTAKIGDLQVDTIKIKNEAVTVPVGVNYSADQTYPNREIYTRSMAALGVPWGQWPTAFDGSVALWEAGFGTLGTITINRKGGKALITATACLVNPSIVNIGIAVPKGSGYLSAAERRYCRMVLSIYRGTTLIARTHIMPSATEGNSGVDFNGTLTLVAVDDSTVTGNVTYTMTMGAGYIGPRTDVMVVPQNTPDTRVTGRSISIVELKK